MNLNPIKPRKALNKAYLKVKPYREDIELFKRNLLKILDFSDDSESEEYHKNLVSGFLKDSLYHDDYFINTSGRNDQVIHVGPKPDSAVGVIIEAKNANNKSEMVTVDNLNKKAFHELLLYFLRERITKGNLEVKNLIITNLFEWYIFDANSFEKLFAANKTLVKRFNDFEAGTLSGTNTDFFYNEIAKPYLNAFEGSLNFVHFDLRKYERVVKNNDLKDDQKLVSLFKIFSPQHLLKKPFENDSNNLDKKFYSELLHIIGLTEIKKGGKKLIQRNEAGQRNLGSLLENTILQLDSRDKISRLQNPKQYGNTKEEQLFNVSLELVITWINRVLFLKLLEAQLIRYHKGDANYAFLNLNMIKDYDDLDSLFFQVLAKKHVERNEEAKALFGLVPYLNSSLFEPTDIEHDTIFISNLRDDKPITIFSSTVLKDKKGKKRSGELSALGYLFSFLDAYDFSSEGAEDIQEDNKTLINASVLGLIFEKINGYKDGSFFTPGFITMYMCKETIRKAVVQKFNEVKDWNCKNLDDVYDKIEDRDEANNIINSLKICDPAVGSGHFLVSALNELIAIKNDLRILQDADGKRLKEYEVEVVNDELVITDDEGELFEYHPNNKESQRVQMALFHEKQTLIENCLFGVDINPNSVKICRLRLWIELLKNAYYKGENELETLPNIDINIKTGNSLISRFALNDDLKDAFKDKKIVYSFLDYKHAVADYKNTASKEKKREILQIINEVKNNFRSSLDNKFIAKFQKAQGLAVNEQERQNNLKAFGQKITKVDKEKLKKLQKKAENAFLVREEIVNNVIYENAFEWRFEFPEVLNNDGDFLGFDVVIGNPPYIRQEELREIKTYLQRNFKTFAGTADLFVYFIELGIKNLNNGGKFSFIIPNKWMRAGYGKALRSFISSYQIDSVLDFGDLQVFEEATTYPCILSVSKSNQIVTFKAVNFDSLQFDYGISDYVNTNSIEVLTPELSDKGWTLTDSRSQKLLSNINSSGESLENYVNGSIYYGIKTGFNQAFIINEEIKNTLIEVDKNSAEIIKPFLVGKDIKRYEQPESDKFLIFTRRGIDIKKYPAILNYLEQFRKKLEPRPKDYLGTDWPGRKPGSYKWYEIQDAVDYYEEFERNKILWPGISHEITSFGYDTLQYYGNDNNQMIITDDKSLLGILNSTLIKFYLANTCDFVRGNYARLKITYISQIPIVEPDEKSRINIENLVNEILNIKRIDSKANTSTLESKIDQMVYELYELTEEEIKIVEDAR